MAVPDMSIPAMGNPGLANQNQQNAFQTLGSIISTAQGMTDLQMARQKQTELSNLATFTKDAVNNPEYKNPDGSINFGKFTKDAIAVAPTYGTEYLAKSQLAFDNGIKLQNALRDTSVENRKALAGFYSPLLDDPAVTKKPGPNGQVQLTPEESLAFLKKRDEADRNAAEFASQHGMSGDFALLLKQLHGTNLADTSQQDVVTGAAQAAHVVQHLDPEEFKQRLIGLGAQTGAAGFPTPTRVDTGTQTVGAVQTAGGALVPGGAPVDREATVNLPGGQVAQRTPGGGYQPLQSSAPGQQGRPPFTPGQPYPKTTLADATAGMENQGTQAQAQMAALTADTTKHIMDTRRIEDGYGNNIAIIDNIRDLSSKTTTGPGAAALWQSVKGRIGGDISNYQTLGAYLDRQAAGIRQTLGLPETNLGTEVAGKITGDLSYQRKAIQAKNDYFESLIQGAHDYKQIQDKIIGHTLNPDTRVAADVRAAFARNFNPLNYEYAQAKSRGDQAAMDRINDMLTPAQVAKMKQQQANIKQLRQGIVPNDDQ